MLSSRKRLVCAAAVAALAFSACGDDDDGGADEPLPTPAPTGGGAGSARNATVEFVTPKDGATVGDRFTADVTLENFELDPEGVGKSPVPGKGHLHFQLDGGKFDIPENSGENGQIAKQLGVDGKYSPAVEPTITYEEIPPGDHTLVVFLANNNHTDTGVEAQTRFTVK
jgi:hypothetical protein